MKFGTLFLAVAAATAALQPAAPACDTCGCFVPTESAPPLYSRGWFAGVGEQFTYFNADRLDSQPAPNPTGQYLASSITQLIAGYRMTDRFSVQFSIPLIYRQYKRPEGFDVQRGTVAGLGDIPLVGNFTLYRTPLAVAPASVRDPKSMTPPIQIPGATWDYPDQPFFATVNVIGGIKLPTGNSSRIKEEFNEIDVEDAPPSGIHGHDLALGSGSVDGIVGLATYVRYHSFFFQADTQYAIRSTGSYDYRYANALSYSGGPGYLCVNRGATRFGLQAVASGEVKGRDHFRGALAEDTGINVVYAGPRLVLSYREKITAELGADLPVFIHNTSFQTVPSFRIRAGLVVRF
jgi:hypothetical protein